MTTASCWQQLQIGHSLIKDSFCMVVYFVYNFLFGCLRASTNIRGDECSGGVGHVDEEPRLARCHVPSSLFISTRNQTTTSFFFIIKYRVFTCIQSAVISFVLVSGRNQAFILHKSYMRYTAQSGGAILAFRSFYIGDHRREPFSQSSEGIHIRILK
jgi:hypothetical protein